MLLLQLYMLAFSWATCSTSLNVNSLFHRSTQFSDGKVGSVFQDWGAYAGGMCDIVIGTYQADAVSFACNGRSVSFVDVGTVADIDFKYNLGNVMGHLVSYSSLRCVTQDDNNQTLVLTAPRTNGGPLTQPLNVTFPDSVRMPALVPSAQHLYLVKYTMETNHNVTLSIIKLYFASVVSNQGNIQSVDVMWDMIYFNPDVENFYGKDITCFVIPDLKNGPLVTGVALGSAAQGPSGPQGPAGNGSFDSGSVIGLSVGVIIVGVLGIIAVITACRGRGSYHQIK